MRRCAIVLTGGASSRMGTDKASLVVDGSTMLDRVLTALGQAGFDDTAIVGPGHVADIAPGQGPMAGVVAGWQTLDTPSEPPTALIAVLACDLPSLNADALDALAQAATAHRHGAVAHDGERPQPLVAVYRPEALGDLARAYEAGERSIRRCFADWDLAYVQLPRTTIADADTPADLHGFDVEWPS